MTDFFVNEHVCVIVCFAKALFCEKIAAFSPSNVVLTLWLCLPFVQHYLNQSMAIYFIFTHVDDRPLTRTQEKP